MTFNSRCLLVGLGMILMSISLVSSLAPGASTGYELVCDSTVTIKVAVAKLEELGYQRISADTIKIQKLDDSVACEGTLNPDGDHFEWVLAGNQIHDCATKYENLENELKFTYVTEMFITSNQVISRAQKAIQSFTCKYDRNQIQSTTGHFDATIAEMKLGTGESKIGQPVPVSLSHYTDKFFNVKSSSDTFEPGEGIFVATDFSIQQTADVVVQLTDCQLIYNSDEYDLIKDGCNQVPDKLEIIKNYAKVQAGFKISAFFLENSNPLPESEAFGLKCSIRLCASRDEDCTQPTCDGTGRRKRSIPALPKSKSSSSETFTAHLGPFHVRRPTCDQQESGCSHACVLDLNRSPVCVCPPQYRLADDGKTCLLVDQARQAPADNLVMILKFHKPRHFFLMGVLALIVTLTTLSLAFVFFCMNSLDSAGVDKKEKKVVELQGIGTC